MIDVRCYSNIIYVYMLRYAHGFVVMDRDYSREIELNIVLHESIILAGNCSSHQCVCCIAMF